ncbi:annetocin receptor-like [Diadema antillarum]|uniref:annetocin receptor-like n=1 Tax=Diadema antillarum TaxID=105358 RepID=UPI003A873398
MGFAISSFNLTAISLERYAAVVHPVWYMASFKRNARYFLVGITLLTAPVFEISVGLVFYRYAQGECAAVDSAVKPSLGVMLFTWDFLIPVAVMSYSFLHVAIKLHSLSRVTAENVEQPTGFNTTDDTRDPNRDVEPNTGEDGLDGPALGRGKRQVKARRNNAAVPAAGFIRRRKTTVTLFIFFISYLVCWIPNQTMFLAENLGWIQNFYGSTFHSLSVALATFNVCVNPLVYAARFCTSAEGRRHFRRLCPSI